MLNLLVEKAIERSSCKSEIQQPIFTISYSSIKPKPKPSSSKELQNKTVINKVPKISRKDNNIFQKWKSKTLQKLKDLSPNSPNAFLPIKPSKNISLKPRHMQHEVELNDEPLQTLGGLKQFKASFIVHKKKIKAKAFSFQGTPNQSPLKSIYLQYKDESKQKKKRIATLSNVYQKKLIENQTQKTIQNQELQKSQNSDNQMNSSSTKNVSFFNTIQYKTVPKSQIRHYKFDEYEHTKRNLLSRAQNIFIRTNKTSNNNDYNLLNNTISVIQSSQKLQFKEHQDKQIQKVEAKKISIRKIYTQKRSRKSIKQICEINPQSLRVNFNNYRPWSPVKTNPLFIHQEQFLFEQSKTFNIFSNLQETKQQQI